MPEETKIDIGDSEESPVDVKLGEDPEKTKEPEIQVEDAPQEEELEEYSAGVKKRIGDLTHKWREAERQQQTAVKFAENVRLENDNLKTRLDSLDKGYQEEFGERVSSQLNSAKKLLKEAHESGDVDKIVEAQEALSNLSFEKTRLAKAKKETAQQVQQPQPQPQVQQPQPQPAAQPDPKAEAWATNNDWFGKDEIMTYAAFGVHRKLCD